MDARMKARFETEGWTVGSAQSFLGLTDEDMALLQEDAIRMNPQLRAVDLSQGVQDGQAAQAAEEA